MVGLVEAVSEPVKKHLTCCDKTSKQHESLLESECVKFSKD